MRSVFKKLEAMRSFFLHSGKTHGRTLYIGKSDWQITFYDKLAERQNKKIDYSDYLKTWNRYEIRLRNHIATEAAHVLAFEAYSLGEFAKGFMSAKIDFKVNSIIDTNKSRWRSQRWWKNFLGECEKLHLTQVAPDPSVEKIGNWLEKQVDTSLATFLEAFDNDQIVLDYFKEKGSEKMTKKHENMLNEFEKISSNKEKNVFRNASLCTRKKTFKRHHTTRR